MKRPLAGVLLPLTLLACSRAPDGAEPLGRHAQAVKPGAVVITELLVNATGKDDGLEWIEVRNVSDKKVDLKDWTLADDKNKVTIDDHVEIDPGGYAVLAQSDKPKDNGGLEPVDLAYGVDLGLGNDGDEIRLLDPDEVEIDRVAYAAQAPWPTSNEGAALSLDPGRLDAVSNDDGGSWCLATATYGDKDQRGTPGKPNPSCGLSGAGGSGQAGQGGGAGAGGAGQSGASGQAGAGGSGGSGQAGAGGCQVRLTKVDVNQPDADAGPKDTAEAVELRVTGDFVAGATTLADCGVHSVSPFDADASDTGACGPAAATYAELAVGDLVIPASGFVVVGNIPASDRPWTGADGAAAAVLKNGPDYLTLRAADGGVVDAVSYADNDAPDVHADCASLASAALLPADANDGGNQVLVRCPDDSWRLVPGSSVTWKAPNDCGAAGSGGSGQAGSGQAGGSAAGAGQAGGGQAAGGAAAGQAAGGQTAGGQASGGTASGGQAAGGAAGEAAAGGQDGDCSCRAAGRGTAGGGLLAALGLAAAAGRRGARRRRGEAA